MDSLDFHRVGPYYDPYKWSDMASPYKWRKKCATVFFSPRNQPTLREIFQFTCPSKPQNQLTTNIVIDAESGNCHKMSEKIPWGLTVFEIIKSKKWFFGDAKHTIQMKGFFKEKQQRQIRTAEILPLLFFWGGAFLGPVPAGSFVLEQHL